MRSRARPAPSLAVLVPRPRINVITYRGVLEPLWNRIGRELFDRSGNRMMAVQIATQPAFAPSKPTMLFENQYASSEFPATGVAYDVSPDGQRFLMVKEGDQAAAPTQINVVLNWFEELKRLAPPKAQ